MKLEVDGGTIDHIDQLTYSFPIDNAATNVEAELTVPWGHAAADSAMGSCSS